MGLTDSINSFFKLPFAALLFLQPHLYSSISLPRITQGGEMIHRAAVSDKALGLLMDRCRATFAKPEPGGGFTLYANANRFPVKYRVTAQMHRAAQKCVRAGAQRLRGKINPIRVSSGIRT
jgi:hypothetical protein